MTVPAPDYTRMTDAELNAAWKAAGGDVANELAVYDTDTKLGPRPVWFFRGKYPVVGRNHPGAMRILLPGGFTVHVVDPKKCVELVPRMHNVLDADTNGERRVGRLRRLEAVTAEIHRRYAIWGGLRAGGAAPEWMECFGPMPDWVAAEVAAMNILRLGPREMAKYPFLDGVRLYVRQSEFTLEQLAGRDLAGVRDVALEQIEAAARGDAPRRADVVGADRPREVLSFLAAVILLKLAKADTLVRRFALYMARRAEAHLQHDLVHDSDDTVRLAVGAVHELSGVALSRGDGRTLLMDVADYLKRAVGFNAREWKLVNRVVHGGKVVLTPHEAVRLIREEVMRHIRDRIQKAPAPDMPAGLQPYVGRVMVMEERMRPRTAAPSGKFPPCIEHAIKSLKDGENLPHSGRFMLGTYLLARGHIIQDIVPYFESAPDFNRRTTEYQLRQLAGGAGDGKPYRCQGCEKLKSVGLCHATAECAGVKHPLQFGRRS